MRTHAAVINFPLNYYDKPYSSEDMFKSWPSLIMNSVNRCHIPYKPTFNFQIRKSGPLLARKMLKYGFRNIKYIGQYDQCSAKSLEGFHELHKFLKSQKSTKFHSCEYDEYNDEYLDQVIKVLSFHHCKKCKELTSRHKRSMFTFVLNLAAHFSDYCRQIHCFVLF